MKDEKEKKEKKLDTNNEVEVHEKSFWAIGIALIIFMILLLGSLIGLYIVRNRIGDIADKVDIAILEDGSKQSATEAIKNAEIVVDGRKFYDFTIKEKEGLSTVEAKVENITEGALEGATFKVSLMDINGELIESYTVLTTELQPGVPTLTVTSIMKDCTGAADIEVELIGIPPVQETAE